VNLRNFDVPLSLATRIFDTIVQWYGEQPAAN